MEPPGGGPAGGDADNCSPLFGGRALGSGMGTLGSESVKRPRELLLFWGDLASACDPGVGDVQDTTEPLEYVTDGLPGLSGSREAVTWGSASAEAVLVLLKRADEVTPQEEHPLWSHMGTTG